MPPKKTERTQVWNLANEYDQHVEELKESLRQEDNDVAALDANFTGWKKEIKALKKKVQDAEIEKTNIRKVNQIQLDEATKNGLQHLETVVSLDNEIFSHASIISQVDRRLTSTRIQYKRIKPVFPF